MELWEVPEDACPDKEAFRILERLTRDFYSSLEERPIRPRKHVPTDLDPLFEDTLGDEGIGLTRALEEFEEKIAPHCIAIPHPLYFGLVNSSPFPSAAFADFLVSTYNNNGGASHQSPAFSAAERALVRKFLEVARMPEGSGIVLPGGSYANLHCLQVARQHSLEGRTALEWRKTEKRLYASDAVHFSVARAAMTLGFDEREVARVPMRGRGAMDPEALAAMMADDVARGIEPVAVVATLGTTGTGAVDPLKEIGAIARQHGAWFHVDACFGGAALLLPEMEDVCQGIEGADSVAIDPHKWFYVPLTAAVAMTRHPDLEKRAFRVEASYIPDSGIVETWQRGFSTSRRHAGFVTWMTLRIHGLDAVRKSVQRNVELIRELEQGLADVGFRILPEGRLSIACARFEPSGVTDPTRLDQLQMELAERVVASGKAWFSTVRHDGLTWLRFNLVNLHTRKRHIDRLVAIVKEASEVVVRDA